MPVGPGWAISGLMHCSEIARADKRSVFHHGVFPDGQRAADINADRSEFVIAISTQGVGGRARLLQIQNDGVQQREINNARDTNGDGDFEISGRTCRP